MAGSSLNIPNVIIAPDLKGLMRAMLANNLKDGKEYGYFDIQKDGDRWVAFFYKHIKAIEILNGTTNTGRNSR